jgi:hypothetical protein
MFQQVDVLGQLSLPSIFFPISLLLGPPAGYSHLLGLILKGNSSEVASFSSPPILASGFLQLFFHLFIACFS